MLVYRIEGIAQHTPRVNHPNCLYPDERVESVYHLKDAPTNSEIEEKVEEVLKTHGPMLLSEIMERMYPFGFWLRGRHHRCRREHCSAGHQRRKLQYGPYRISSRKGAFSTII